MNIQRALSAFAAVILLLLPLGAAAQDASPPAVTVEQAIPYGEVDGIQLLLDVHRPPVRDVPRPAVLLFHGGGLAFGDRAWMHEWAVPLAEAGYVAFSIGYRFLGEDGSNRWPAQLDDAQRAVRWVRANAEVYGVDPERVCALGHSSGAVLSAHLGTRETRDNGDAALADQSSRVRCVVDIAGGAMDLTIPDPDGNAANLLGGTPEEVPDAYSDFSPVSHIDAATAPFLVLHGPSDGMAPVDHSRALAAALHAAGIEVVYAEIPGIDHLDWHWSNAGIWVEAFLDTHLHPED